MPIRNRPTEGQSWDERSLLLTTLGFTQDVALWKVRGLTEEQARATPLPTSPLTSPANILNHLRWVESSWIDDCILGTDSHRPGDDEHPDAISRKAQHSRSTRSSGSTRKGQREPAPSLPTPTSTRPRRGNHPPPR